MNITKLSERSRLQRIIREAPDNIDARKALASLFWESGDFVRAAAELMSISRVHVSRGEGDSARNACRQALEFDPANLELRLLLAQVHARFPAGEVRAAAPIVAAVVELPVDEPTLELAPAPLLDEIPAVVGDVPVVDVETGFSEVDDMFAGVAQTAQGRPAGRSEPREPDTADVPAIQVGASDLIEIPDAIGYKDEDTAPTGGIPQVPAMLDPLAETEPVMEPVANQRARTSRGSVSVPAGRATDSVRHGQPTGPDSVVAVSPAPGLAAAGVNAQPPKAFSRAVPQRPGHSRTAPVASTRVTPPPPKSAPPTAPPSRVTSPTPIYSESIEPLPNPVDSAIEPKARPNLISDYIGLGVDDETPMPSQFGASMFRSTGPTHVGGDDLSPRPTSGFEQRVSATERLRGEPPLARTVVGPAPDHFTLSDIPANPLTDRLPRPAREALFRRLLYVKYTDEAAVIDAGRQLDALMLVQDGVVRVVNGPLVGDATHLCRMSDGELIGAFEFLTRSHSRVSLQAEGPLGMLELPRVASDELRREDAQIGDAIRAVLRERLVSNLMDRAPIFASVRTDQRRDLAGRFFTVDVESAEPILQEGEINRRLFLLQSGELVVDSRGGKGGRMTLRPGDFFGFVSTLLGRPVQVDVVASAPSSLLVLPEQEVYRLVAGNKGVARTARREAVERGDQPISVHSIGGLGGLLVRRPEFG